MSKELLHQLEKRMLGQTDSKVMTAWKTDSKILCANEKTKADIERRAKEMGLDISEPVVPKGLYGFKTDEVYLDEFVTE